MPRTFHSRHGLLHGVWRALVHPVEPDQRAARLGAVGPCSGAWIPRIPGVWRPACFAAEPGRTR